ncbi:predicted protein [Aspergillus terreus NIH2624]|uniref:Uncharacterized protein n=1 Tax=Aspergillus terreus (strain NIH 2624 / FGSC A1156) TaxID=341663 RepID=Q0C840_ASPTN|nr:uncharacterized protein ATEG_10144 [Aspergillus terreus NIH2624]EAU29593.1 predicted protein [Aspergillus terreus NIH2624]
MQRTMNIGARLGQILKTLYLFGKSDIPVVVPSSVKNQIDGVEEDRLAKAHRPLPSGRISLGRAWVLYVMLFALMWAVSVHARTVKCTFAYTVAIVAYNEGGLAKVPIVKNGHAQDFRDRSGDAYMDRKTIPLLISQPAARWSLAVLMMAWTVGVVAFWQPPVAASVALAGVGLRCLHGYISSYDERHDYVSYYWYGVWLLGANVLPLFARLRGET